MTAPDPASAEPFGDGLTDTIIGLDGSGGQYPIAKLEAHLKSTPHRAVSMFLTANGHLLMQRRAAGKYHSAGLWANSACSHPLWGESSDACAQRTLLRELGLTASLSQFAVIRYEARVGALFENEIVDCFHGQLDRSADVSGFKRDEVGDVRWVALDDIGADVAARPDLYAPWFAIYVAQGLLAQLPRL